MKKDVRLPAALAVLRVVPVQEDDAAEHPVFGLVAYYIADAIGVLVCQVIVRVVERTRITVGNGDWGGLASFYL